MAIAKGNTKARKKKLRQQLYKDFMNKSKIQIGKTYCNSSGTVNRKVLDIGTHVEPEQYNPKWDGGFYRRPNDEPGVKYEVTSNSNGRITGELYLKSFASWAGKEVEIL
jgi:hypothetical protein